MPGENTASKLRVLIAEDQTLATSRLVRTLQSEAPGWTLNMVPDPESALDRIQSGRCDLVLLDWNFGNGTTGLDLCRRVRNTGSSVPIVMHTHHKDVADRVTAFQVGADDFVVKGTLPAGELHQKLACVYLLSRSRSSSPDRSSGDMLEFGPLTVHLDTRAILVRNAVIRLPRQQQDILIRLARAGGDIVPLEDLCSAGGLSPGIGFKNVHNEISRLRKRLGPDAGSRIQTLRLLGYRLTQQ